MAANVVSEINEKTFPVNPLRSSSNVDLHPKEIVCNEENSTLAA